MSTESFTPGGGENPLTPTESEAIQKRIAELRATQSRVLRAPIILNLLQLGVPLKEILGIMQSINDDSNEDAMDKPNR